MWNNTRSLLDLTGHAVWNEGTERLICAQPCPNGYDVYEHGSSIKLKDPLEAHLLAMDLYRTLHKKAAGLPNAAPSQDFLALFSSTVTNLAKRIERQGEWSLISALYSVEDNWNWLGFKAQATFLHGIVKTVHLLVGDERRCLVGTKNNVPAWKALEQPATLADYPKLVWMLDLPTEYICQADVDIVSQPATCLGDKVFERQWPKDITWYQIRMLIEGAYYNQRYLIHPMGASVRINGYPGVNGITLKARKSMWDENSHDLLANFELDNGTYFTVLEASLATGFGMGATESDHISVGPQLFFYFLIAQIYHDLVTSRDISIHRGGRRGKDKGFDGGEALSSVPTDNPSWVFIPRVVRGTEYDPRVEASSPRIISPHHVTGHLRKANMSEEHRLALVRFEEETGLQVLRFVPEGYTFVRPHVSPKTDSDEFAKLPKFIKARIQDDIEKLLTSQN